jgi:hypothetical protein
LPTQGFFDILASLLKIGFRSKINIAKEQKKMPEFEWPLTTSELDFAAAAAILEALHRLGQECIHALERDGVKTSLFITIQGTDGEGCGVVIRDGIVIECPHEISIGALETALMISRLATGDGQPVKAAPG